MGEGTELGVDMISLYGSLLEFGEHVETVSVMIDGCKRDEHVSGWREISW